jgi:quercetin dioxygenase-like cupin family protein
MFNVETIIHLPSGNIPYTLRNHDEMCGTVEAEQNDDLPDSPASRAAYVRFTDGAHTKWHRHHGLQVLLVIEGLGFVEQKDSHRFEIKPGDRVYIPANVLHRHGAQQGQKMVHLAFTDGKTDWYDMDPCD